MNIKSPEIIQLLSLTGARILGFTTVTEPKMRKTDNPYLGKVFKVSRFTAMVNFMYDNNVRAALIKEGKNPDEFAPGESWHSPILNDGKMTPFCSHNKTGDVYMRLRRLKGGSRFVDGQGRFFKKALIEPFLQEPTAYKNQGLAESIQFITLKLSSVRTIRGLAA